MTEIVDTQLVYAIDCGFTLVTSHLDHPPWGQHKKTFAEVEMARLPHIYATAVRNGMPDCGIEAVTPKFLDDSVIGSDPAGHACMTVLKHGAWPKEMIDAEATYIDTITGPWCIHLPAMDRSQSLFNSFMRLHSRYAAYEMIHGHDPVPSSDIWCDIPWAFDDEAQMIHYERELVRRYPPRMEVIEIILDPNRVRYRLDFPWPHHVPAPAPPQPKKKRSRNRGTSWDLASPQMSVDEIATLKRSLRLPCLSSLTEDVIESLEYDLNMVDVEIRQRGQNTMKHVKTEENKRRSEAPVVRYDHPLFTEDVVDAVLALQGKKENPYGDKAPTRVACVCCLLYLHDIPVDMWVQSSNFPRPPKRSSM